jgi:phage protein D
MAWRNVYRPHVNVVTPAYGDSQRFWVEDLTCWMAEQAHQVVELTVVHVLNKALPTQTALTPAGVVWPENSPVHLQYGWWADDSGDFFGYVVSHRVASSETQARYGHAIALTVVYTCVGASLPMQSYTSRLWQDVSPSYIATTIARSYHLQPHVDYSLVHFTSRMQTASDWHFLADLTTRANYRLFLDGVNLWFADRHTVMPATDNSVPVFQMSKEPGQVNSLREFSAVVGDTDPAGGVRATYQTTSLNRSSGVMMPAQLARARTDLLGNQVDPMITRHYSNRPVHSYSEAQTLLDADTTLLWVESRAVTNGDPRIKPGSIVDLEGDAVGSQNQGIWMVRAATHKLTVNHSDPRKTEYTTHAVLGRDNAQSLILPIQKPATPAPPTVLVSGRWRAQYTT